MDIKFYYVDPEYIEYLKNAEIKERGFTCVPNVTYANREKFFYGAVITKKSGISYFVPISSQTKDDANSILIKTDDKKNQIKGSLRFAYMIPVPRQMLIPMDFSNAGSEDRKRLLQKELAFCRRNKDRIARQATKSYVSISQSTSQKLRNKSCDFALLEKAYLDFCAKKKLPMPTITESTETKETVLTGASSGSTIHSAKKKPKL